MKEKIYTEEDLNQTIDYQEKDLHPALAKWLYDKHKIYTRTICQSDSSNTEKGENEWLHPDMVGVEFTKDDEIPAGSDLESLKNNIEPTPKAVIYSFELKKELTLGKLKEYYFQAVSNSTWANQGYLVVSEMDKSNQKLTKELKRLVDHFGIGVILLNMQNIHDSGILHSAAKRDEINFETLEKFYEINNTGLIQFIRDVNSYIESFNNQHTRNRVIEGFDKVLGDEDWKNYLNNLKCTMYSSEPTPLKNIEVKLDQQESFIISNKLKRISFDDDWEGKSFRKIVYKKDIQEVKHCISVYSFIIHIILKEFGEQPFNQYCDDKEGEKGKKGRKPFSFVSNSIKQMTTPKNIEEFNFYFEANLSNNVKRDNLLKLLNYTTINPNDIQIWIEPSQK